jgi:hypothetical protein
LNILLDKLLEAVAENPEAFSSSTREEPVSELRMPEQAEHKAESKFVFWAMLGFRVRALTGSLQKVLRRHRSLT